MMRTIEQRLQILECQFRRARRVNRVLTFALIAIVCIAGAQATTPPDSKPKTSKTVQPPDGNSPDDRVPPGRDRLRTVEADQFVLLDRLGRSRATMVVTDHGPAISMFDENGQKRLEFSHTSNASGLRLLDSNESPVASLQILHDVARAHLEIRSPQGRSLTRAEGFTVQDGANNGRLQLALVNGNFPVLGISQGGQSGPHSVEITASDDGARGLKMHDQVGHPLFSVSAANNGRTYLNMRHPDHERSLQISAGPKDADGPLIELFAPAKQDGTGGLLAPLQFGLRKDRQPYIRIVDSDGRPLFTAPAK
jgi:hypothetical protein